jgi:glutathione S-transferase
MYELFISNKNYSSWSLRPWVLMQELSIPFVEHLVPFSPGSNWAAFRAFSPTGRVPCLHDSDTVIWDSLGIAEYLAERDRRVWPAEQPARSWAHCAVAEMHSGFSELRQACPMSCGVRVQLGTLSEALRGDLARLAELWSEGLARFGGPFLAGPAFTAADAFFAPVAFRVQTYDLQLPAACAGYARRLLALGSMQAWYSAALLETWREPDHEEELARSGRVTADLRAVAGFSD